MSKLLFLSIIFFFCFWIFPSQKLFAQAHETDFNTNSIFQKIMQDEVKTIELFADFDLLIKK